MKISRIPFYFISGMLLLCLISCHLDEKKKTPPAPTSTSTSKPSQSKVKKAFIWSGALEVTNGKRYRSLLRDYRKCDPCSLYFGPLQCKNFTWGTVELQLNQNTELPAKAILRITPRISKHNDLPIFGFLGVCGFIYPHGPVELTGTAKYWNDYRGFHIKFTGSTHGVGGLSYVILRSENSSPLENGILEVNMYYGGSADQSFEFGRAELENPNLENLYPSQTGGR